MRKQYPHLKREERGFVVFDVVKDILQYLKETQPKAKKTKEKSN
jgi:Fe-S oxidoreductase